MKNSKEGVEIPLKMDQTKILEKLPQTLRPPLKQLFQTQTKMNKLEHLQTMVNLLNTILGTLCGYDGIH